MAELSLLAASFAATSPSGIFHSEQAIHKPPKEFQSLLSLQEGKLYGMKPSSLLLNSPHSKDFCWSIDFRSGYAQSFWPSLMAEKSDIIDVRGSCPDLQLFNSDIARKCTRHDKVLKTFISGLKSMERWGLDLSLFPDLMRFDAMETSMFAQHFLLVERKFLLHSFCMNVSDDYLHPQKQFYIPEHSIDFVANTFPTSAITIHSDDQLLFSGRETSIKDLLSVSEEFGMPKRLINGSKKSLIVPYFTRKGRGHSNMHSQISSSNLQTQTVPPAKHNKPKKVQKKKQNRKPGKVRDLYQGNSFHAFERFLSVVLNKNSSNVSIDTLKKSGTEIGHFLNQFSAWIAGTGIAVVVSVLCKMTCTRAPLCSAKLLNTGLGLGLFWLSFAVNNLRDTILNISKDSDKLKLKGEISEKIERHTNEILFRAMTLIAVAALKLV